MQDSLSRAGFVVSSEMRVQIPLELNTFKMSVVLKFMIKLQNLTTTNQRKSGEGKYVRKLTKLDVVTARIRYRVNRV